MQNFECVVSALAEAQVQFWNINRYFLTKGSTDSILFIDLCLVNLAIGRYSL